MVYGFLKMIKEMNNPLHIPLLTFNVLISSIDFWYFPSINRSFVKDFTFEIPIKASSTIETDSAEKSCACLDSFFMNRPKKTATIAITGTVATIINANFQEIKTNKIIDPTTVTIWRKNS